MMAIILAHIYIGTLGMEGAFEPMWSGRMDVGWALHHHGAWVASHRTKPDSAPVRRGSTAPAQ
jgi:formate dehydrogenase subunit gamma